MRLIDADAAIKFIDEHTEPINKDYEKTFNLGQLKELLGAIWKIDAAPVVHGKWVFTEYEYFSCSVCGGSYYNGAETTAQANSYLASGNTHIYCHDCGAKMDGGNP